MNNSDSEDYRALVLATIPRAALLVLGALLANLALGCSPTPKFPPPLGEPWVGVDEDFQLVEGIRIPPVGRYWSWVPDPAKMKVPHWIAEYPGVAYRIRPVHSEPGIIWRAPSNIDHEKATYVLSPNDRYLAVYGGYLSHEDRKKLPSYWNLDQSVAILDILSGEIVFRRFRPQRSSVTWMDWSSDSRWLYWSINYYSETGVFNRIITEERAVIERVEVGTGRVEVVYQAAPFYIRRFRVSPDGSRLLIERPEFPAGGRGLLSVVELASGAATDMPVEELLWWGFSWSPDGQHVYFQDGRGIVHASSARPTEQEVLLSGRFGYWIGVSPDGRWIAFQDITKSALELYDIQRERRQRVFWSLQRYQTINNLQWSSDSRFLSGTISQAFAIPKGLFGGGGGAVQHYLFIVHVVEKKVWVSDDCTERKFPRYFIENPEVIAELEKVLETVDYGKPLDEEKIPPMKVRPGAEVR